MRELQLSPRQIIVPFEFLLGSEGMLRLYFRIIQRGSADLVPPVLVARPAHSDRDFLRTRAEKDDPENEGFFAAIDRLVAERGAYYLIDGNHRAVAATLCRRTIAALELESDDDIAQLEAMHERGEYLDLPSFPMDYFDHGILPTRLATLVTTLEDRHLGKEILTLDERIRRLVAQREIPGYMIRWYRARRRAGPAR